MKYRVELEQVDDSRWIAEVPYIPGAMLYGLTLSDALRKVQALAARVLAARMDGES